MRARYLFVVALIISMWSCEQEDSKPSELGKFWFGESGFPVSGAFFISRMDADSVPIITLSIYSGFEYYPESSTVGQITGLGNVLEVSCRSDEAEKLSPAHYDFSDTTAPFTIKESILKLRYMVSTATGDSIMFNEGNISISGETESKKLIYYFKSENGTELSGHYEGPIRFYKLRSDQM